MALPSCLAAPARGEPTASFVRFDRLAHAGADLSVVFFGASLTWGANASDPQQTSYRPDLARRLETTYPRAHFRFFDASIGGTGSQLGIFRLERDVLRRKPDLVFLDFTANDGLYSADPETLTSYEALIRRLVMEAHAPVVQVMFCFAGDVARGNTQGMVRRDAHLVLSRAYHTAVGDAIALGQRRVREGETTVSKLWDIDGGHPGDAGYALFADAAWAGFQEGVHRGLVCAVPAKMLYADTYMTSRRVRLTHLGPLPPGWQPDRPNRISAYYDMLMSRWLDDEAVASVLPGRAVDPLRVRFRGSMALLFGEETPKSCRYRVTVDGRPSEYDAGDVARGASGNVRLVQTVAQGLDPGVWHTLEILPLQGNGQELRLESLCVAGGPADIEVAGKPGVGGGQQP